MLNLYSILFEGMVKVPPVLHQQVQDSVAGSIVATWLYDISQQIHNEEENIKENNEILKQWKESIGYDIDFINKNIEQVMQSGERKFTNTNILQFGNPLNLFSTKLLMVLSGDEIIISYASKPPLVKVPVNDYKQAAIKLSERHLVIEKRVLEKKELWSSNLLKSQKYLQSLSAPTITVDKPGEDISVDFPLDDKSLAGWSPGGIEQNVSNLKQKNLAAILIAKLFPKDPNKNKGLPEFPVLTVKILFEKNNPNIGFELAKNSNINDGAAAHAIFKWVGHQATMSIVVKEMPGYETSELTNFLSQIRSTIEHELVHLTQNLFRIIKTGSYHKDSKQELQYGLPSRKFSGKDERLHYSPNVPHDQLDSEFYSNLVQVRDQIAKELRVTPEAQRVKLFRQLIGIEETNNTKHEILALKKTNNAKWAKAIKELYKELQINNVF